MLTSNQFDVVIFFPDQLLMKYPTNPILQWSSVLSFYNHMPTFVRNTMEHNKLSDKERVKLHLPLLLTQHTAAMTGCPVIVYWGLSEMSWPEYLQGYAGLGILQTPSSLIRPARVVGENRRTCQWREGNRRQDGCREVTSLKETLHLFTCQSQ